MTRWTAFAALSTVVLFLLLGLARLSQAQFSSATEPQARTAERAPEAPAALDGPSYHPALDHDPGLASPERSPVAAAEAEASMSAGALLANVALSQGVFGAMLVAAAVWANVPLAAFGVGRVTTTHLAVGVGLGVLLWVASEAAGRVAERFGVAVNERMRGALAPDSVGGWVVLLTLVLPTVAVFEELLFRGVLVGAMATGFGLSPWLLAVGSSVAFAVGHGAQGRAGIVATGVLGFVLAAAFVLTDSLTVVVVAHYLVNALVFLVHERP
ncbi:CPBP family intramembrane glutamic endopeptidase [Halobaculum limi]|uniref:CPBP family intramembrane glutamic endopeptidase n=1 Tax=Halobaculum limi TaxID=3031916 RepID=UPI0024062233|nr:CPBP family intramembrane glutamic endopeptidase [Halobaculum sp. YSMS11]